MAVYSRQSSYTDRGKASQLMTTGGCLPFSEDIYSLVWTHPPPPTSPQQGGSIFYFKHLQVFEVPLGTKWGNTKVFWKFEPIKGKTPRLVGHSQTNLVFPLLNAFRYAYIVRRTIGGKPTSNNLEMHKFQKRAKPAHPNPHRYARSRSSFGGGCYLVDEVTNLSFFLGSERVATVWVWVLLPTPTPPPSCAYTCIVAQLLVLPTPSALHPAHTRV